jgi:hypothetical protein
MYKITMVHSRTDIETPFHRRGSEIIEMATNAKLNGKLLSEVATLSEDKLSTTYIAVWDSFASFDAFAKEELVIAFRTAKTEHNIANGIIERVNKQETI